jgi:hypothetical protein
VVVILGSASSKFMYASYMRLCFWPKTCAYMYVYTYKYPLAQKKRLPLHCAAERQAGPEVVAALLLAYPDAASTPDEVRCRGGVGLCACVFMCVFILYANVR